MKREKLKELLREFTKEELITMYASMIDQTVENDRQEEMILKAHQLFKDAYDQGLERK